MNSKIIHPTESSNVYVPKKRAKKTDPDESIGNSQSQDARMVGQGSTSDSGGEHREDEGATRGGVHSPDDTGLVAVKEEPRDDDLVISDLS